MKEKSKKLTFTQAKHKFFRLPISKQEEFLKDLWKFSPDVKLLFQNRFADQINDGTEFVAKMQKATRLSSGEPRDISLRELNSIIAKAKKSYIPEMKLIELERMAYRGIVKWANEYGYFPETMENSASRHLENCLNLIKDFILEKSEQETLYEREQSFLNKMHGDNFYS